jgi:hypothetical protein
VQQGLQKHCKSRNHVIQDSHPCPWPDSICKTQENYSKDLDFEERVRVYALETRHCKRSRMGASSLLSLLHRLPPEKMAPQPLPSRSASVFCVRTSRLNKQCTDFLRSAISDNVPEKFGRQSQRAYNKRKTYQKMFHECVEL